MVGRLALHTQRLDLFQPTCSVRPVSDYLISPEEMIAVINFIKLIIKYNKASCFCELYPVLLSGIFIV